MSKERVPAGLRRQVVERARGACEYCRSQARFATASFAAEHVIPSRRGGQTEFENLALACEGCNAHKYDKIEGRDPVTGAVVPLFNPRQQRWEDHFVWTEACTLIEGITPTGRATVQELHLNREGLVNLRQVLFALGLHPLAEPRADPNQ